MVHDFLFDEIRISSGGNMGEGFYFDAIEIAKGDSVGPGQIRNSGPMGTFSLSLDLTMIPQPTGFVAGIVGQSWSSQTWHRDFAGGMTTSNVTDGTEVVLQM